MWVGMVTIVVVLSLFTGASSGGSAFFAGVLVWLFSLGGGVLLSAPAFLNPPEYGGIWSFRVALPLWLFLAMMKMTSWVGFYILLGVWMLIFKVWNTHQAGKLPTFGNAPQPAYAPRSAYAPQPAYGGGMPAASQVPFTGGLPPAAWLADPTGRYPHRWWDGMRWTDRVANGGVQAVDPL
jgi:hypothetical protein